MITIHHLAVSQSERIVWLMEELGLAYGLKWYDRKADHTAPDDYLALHPAATAPVISDGELVLAESAVILEHICYRHAGGRFAVRPEQENYEEYSYWMHFNNNVQALSLGKMALRAEAHGPLADMLGAVFERRENGYFNYLDRRLARSPYLAGPEFTCADMMVTYNLTTLPLFGGRKIDDLPNVVAYVERITGRPAYRRAMAIAGPGATAPA